jgi:hypothetical protein
MRMRMTGRGFGLGLGVSLSASLLLGGCSLDNLLKRDQLPPNVSDPAITQTPTGAVAAYNGTVAQFRAAFAGGGNGGSSSNAQTTGLLSDELRDASGNQVEALTLDSRSLPEGGTTAGSTHYNLLHLVRGDAGQAIGLLTRYLPDQPTLVGHLYALEGYAEVLLAETFCSGIPLSTVDYTGDYTLRPASTTAEVLTHARALFDSALALAGDSTRFVNLAAVGKGRALLGLGDYAGAAAAVAAVPDAYQYAASYTTAAGANALNFATSNQSMKFTVEDFAGGTGLDYRSSGDPRTAVTQMGTYSFTVNSVTFTFPVYYPNKYSTTGDSPVVVASGVEARLIEAEAALQAGDAATWLTKLNTLRTAGLVTITADTLRDTLGITGCTTSVKCGADGVVGGTFHIPPRYVLTDSVQIGPPMSTTLRTQCINSTTTYAPCRLVLASSYTWVRRYVATDRWSAGTGGVANLPPLTDPGTAAGRVDLLFRERAFWLFLTGHRQGDLRRLIRQYGRTEDQVFPVGTYPNSALGALYGDDVTVPVPLSEQTGNPLFTGCITRDP